MSNSSRPHGLQLHPWDFPGKSTLEWGAIDDNRGFDRMEEQREGEREGGWRREQEKKETFVSFVPTVSHLYHSWCFGNIHLFNSQTKNLGEVELSLLCVCVLSCFTCAQLFVTPWIVALQAPLSMEFSRQEYWSGLPCPFQGIFLTQGSNSCLLHWQAGSLPLAPPREPTNCSNGKSKGLDCSQASTESGQERGFQSRLFFPLWPGHPLHKMHCFLQILPLPPLMDPQPPAPQL